MLPVPLPSTEVLRACLSYDPATGLLTWKTRPQEQFENRVLAKRWNVRFPGQPALNCIGPGGYRLGAVRIVSTRYSMLAHRVAFKLVTGVDPEWVDHRNGDRSDNRWANLREATAAQNGYNRAPSGRTVSKGVYPTVSGKFRVLIGKDGATKHLGTFPTVEAAKAARDAVAIRLHGDFYLNGDRADDIFG